VICEGCRGEVPEGEQGTVWISTPIGTTTAKTHRDAGCAELAVAAQSEQPAKRIREPLTREQRAALGMLA
jgi:hypothetical protein